MIRPSKTLSYNCYIDGVPGPGRFESRGIFDKGSPQRGAFTFGMAREHFKKIYLPDCQTTDPCVPGPGAY